MLTDLTSVLEIVRERKKDIINLTGINACY